jgi:hypothetical protein
MKHEYILIGMLVVILIVLCVWFYTSQNLRRTYKKEVKSARRVNVAESELLTEKDLIHLPKPVQKYLTYTGAIGKEKVHSFRVIADGKMKMNKDKDWAKIKIEQNNFIGIKLVRFFYLRMKMFGIPIYVLHSYTEKGAFMFGKLAGMFTVINSKGIEMRISDTITLLNDMCFFAPATLIDERISWEQIDNTTVNARFKTEYCIVTATLYFNENNELINFTTEDRYYTNRDGTYQKVRWTTPLSDYKEISGLKLPSCGVAIWNLPDGDFSYCKFTNIKSIIYNEEQ